MGIGLEVTGLTKVYAPPRGAKVSALAGVTLTIPPASVTAIMGPSGSGKSTLLHLIGGMDRPDTGSIMIDGDYDLTALTRGDLVEYRRSVGFVFQSFALLPALTARDNVLLPVLPYKVAGAALRAADLLADVGLAGRETALPSQLSGGQRQRVAIARALMGEPRLLVADEPTGNLDSTSGAQVLELLRRSASGHGQTVVMVTHDPVAAAYTDRVIFLADGRVVDEVRDPTREQVLAIMTRMSAPAESDPAR